MEVMKERLASALPRLLLLVLLMLGVAAMHTLGHVGDHDAPRSPAIGMLHAHGTHVLVPDPGSGEAPSGTPDIGSVCLAILAALLVLAPFGLRISVTSLEAWLRSRFGRCVPILLRGPPPLPLMLIRTVVLRT